MVLQTLAAFVLKYLTPTLKYTIMVMQRSALICENLEKSSKYLTIYITICMIFSLTMSVIP